MAKNIYALVVIITLALQSDFVAAQNAAQNLNQNAMVPTSQSIAKFKARVQQNGDDLASRSVLGQLYLRRAKEADRFHDYIAAEKQFEKIVDAKPDNHSANVLLAYSYLSQHRFKESNELAQKLLADKPGDTLSLAISADALMQLGNYSLAKHRTDHLIKQSKSPSSLVRLAAYQETFGDNQSAISTLKEAIDMQVQLGDTNERNAWYFLRHAQLLFDAGSIKESLAQIDRAMKLVEEYPQALALKGRIFAGLGKFDKAITFYEQAISLSEEPPTLVALGDTLQHLGQTKRANQLFERAEKLMEAEEQDPLAGPPHARERAIYYSDHNKRLDHAVDLAREDLKVRSDIYSHDTLAWALHQNKQHAEAIKYSRRAIATGTSSASILYHAGMIEIANGNERQGHTLLREALQSNPYFSYGPVAQIREILGSE